MNFSEVVILISAGTTVLLILAGFIVSFIFIHRHKQHKNIQDIQQLQTQFSQTLLQSQLEIQEQTLQHFSNELHDNIAQVASIIQMNLHTINLKEVNKAAQKLEDTKELTQQLIGDIRALSIHLNGDRVAQIGLCKALETEIERINKTGLFAARFEQDDNSLFIDDGKAIILYRMAQEILNNMVKHSNAKEIRLALSCNEETITVTVSDNGCGFDVEDKLKNGDGAGLHNLQKRAALINAALTIESHLGDGTNITIRLPHSYARKTATVNSFN